MALPRSGQFTKLYSLEQRKSSNFCTKVEFFSARTLLSTSRRSLLLLSQLAARCDRLSARFRDPFSQPNGADSEFRPFMFLQRAGWKAAVGLQKIVDGLYEAGSLARERMRSVPR